MSKRTAGEKFAAQMGGFARPVEAAKKLDAILRREKAEAWDECRDLMKSSPNLGLIANNPYRGRAKR